MASSIKPNSQLLLNQESTTFKITVEQLTERALEIIVDSNNTISLSANDLADVTIASTGVDSTRCGAGEFLMVLSSDTTSQTLVNVNFAEEVNKVVSIESVFDLDDVSPTGAKPADLDYTGTVLFGESAGGTNVFKPAVLDDKIYAKVNALFGNLNLKDDTTNVIPQYTYQLLDVGPNANSATVGYDPGDVLIYHATGSYFENKPLGGSTGLIITDINSLLAGSINGTAVAVAKYAADEDVTNVAAALGVVAIKKSSGLMISATGLLEVDPASFPDVPDAFRYRNTFYWDTSGVTHDATSGGNVVVPADYAPVLVGDIFVGIERAGTAAGATAALTEWLDANGQPLSPVENGQLVVCINDGDAGSGPVVANSRYARMGVLDYNPAAIGLQQVLDVNNKALKKNIELEEGSVVLTTLGNFTTEVGSFSTGAGNITTTKGEITTTEGGVTCSTVLTAGTGDTGKVDAGSLSVSHIDFDRIPALS